jgi:hypothetical protein
MLNNTIRIVENARTQQYIQKLLSSCFVEFLQKLNLTFNQNID